MSIKVYNEHDKNKWNVAIQIDSEYDTWYSYRFKKYYCGDKHTEELRCICCFENQDEYVNHMQGAHNKTYKNPKFVLPKLPQHIIIDNDVLTVIPEMD